jgi:hypothetical protein
LRKLRELCDFSNFNFKGDSNVLGNISKEKKDLQKFCREKQQFDKQKERFEIK